MDYAKLDSGCQYDENKGIDDSSDDSGDDELICNQDAAVQHTMSIEQSCSEGQELASSAQFTSSTSPNLISNDESSDDEIISNQEAAVQHDMSIEQLPTAKSTSPNIESTNSNSVTNANNIQHEQVYTDNINDQPITSNNERIDKLEWDIASLKNFIITQFNPVSKQTVIETKNLFCNEIESVPETDS